MTNMLVLSSELGYSLASSLRKSAVVLMRRHGTTLNLIGYEFYSIKEYLNLHDVIEKLGTNKKIDLLAAA